MASILRLVCEGSYGYLYAQNIRDHVGAKPANQRGATGSVVSLPVVEEETIHLQADIQRQTKVILIMCFWLCIIKR